MKNKNRSESDVFTELIELCSAPGYLHAISFFCSRDNTISYEDVITSDDMFNQIQPERLVRTEISTLIGLACKGEIDYKPQPPNIIKEYIIKTERLLNDLHQSMMLAMKEKLDINLTSNADYNPLKNGATLRELIFYGGETAYDFQYLELSRLKYVSDNRWLEKNKGFSIENAIDVILAIQKFQSKKINNSLSELIEKDQKTWNMLDVYTFTVADIALEIGLSQELVRNVISSFVSTASLNDFKSLDDFNPKNAYPIIQLNQKEYALFQNYSLTEALYENPFFWFYDDKDYRNVAMKNRGDFTESFSAKRLENVFGKKNVYQNIKIIDSKSQVLGEIDVLVTFAERAIVLQAKSKRLTIASRKGNDFSLQNDFEKAVQNAYEQAYLCSKLIPDESYKLISEDGSELYINRIFREIYPFCVVSDHYPALSVQAKQFLIFKETEVIKPPFVMDVFFLDTLSEMLDSPLYFLSYINRRTLYNEKILSAHELTVLSYHLKRNLWIEDDYTIMHFNDDICIDIDLAMMSRRLELPGTRTPEGILTKLAGTTLGKLIDTIDNFDDSDAIDLGFMLLQLGEDTLDELNNGIDYIAQLTLSDGRSHDFTIALDTISTGLTVHCNKSSLGLASINLRQHAEKRKYKHKAQEWFALCIDPENKKLRFLFKLYYDWERSNNMDDVLEPLASEIRLTRNNLSGSLLRRKIGRNEACPCGSGLKYKKCCINKI